MMMELQKLFIEELKSAGWKEVVPFVEYHQGNWRVVFDTSAWMEVGTKQKPRVFDVPVPEMGLAGWTLGLIEHLCRCEDELGSLGKGR